MVHDLGQPCEIFVAQYSLASLRVLGSVGEPINPEAWRWYHEVVGRGNCPIVDTWWQTETGGILLTPLPAHGGGNNKPGSATFPFHGIEPALLDPTTMADADDPTKSAGAPRTVEGMGVQVTNHTSSVCQPCQLCQLSSALARVRRATFASARRGRG